MNQGQDLALQLTLAGSGLLVGVILYVLKKLTDFLNAKTKSSELRSFWARADDLAERVVKETFQATSASLATGQSLTPAALESAKQAALAKLKSYLGGDGLKMLEYLAIGGNQNLDAFLGTFVAAAAHDLAQGVATKAAAVALAETVKAEAPVVKTLTDAVKGLTVETTTSVSAVTPANPLQDPAKSS